MNIVVSLKVVPDDQDLQTGSDGTLDTSKAKPVVSSFDLNALEVAALLAASRPDNKLVALTAGSAYLDDSKLKKNILSRGPEELYCVIDDKLTDADTHVTAHVLAAALKKIENLDLVICGDGSADVYAQQVGIQLGEILGIPTINAVSHISFEGNNVVVERTLETVKEIVELPLPAVVNVTSDSATPRVCGMKEILAAGKKPITTWSLGDLDCSVSESVETAATYVPKSADRKLEIYDVAIDGDLKKFIRAIAAELR
jgi:electron transfer flavoprotein beta subunit